MQKIAVISPSRTLTQKISELLKAKNLVFVIEQAGQSNATEIAGKLIEKGTRVIISRGNTAHMLRKNFNIPVVDVQHTFHDCFSCYQEALKLSGKIAFLATSEAYLRTLNKYRELLPKAVICPIYPLDENRYVNERLDFLLNSGIEVAIGGLSLEQEVLSRGISYIMTSTDEDSVNDAIDEALHLTEIAEERDKKEQELQNRYETIRAIFNCVAEGILHIDCMGTVTDINDTAVKLLAPLKCGESVNALIKPENLSKILHDGEILRAEMVNYREKPLLINVNPICVEDTINGAVITIQQQTEIQSMEQKIRRRLLAKGHVSDKSFEDIIGQGEAIDRARKLAVKYASVDSTLLIAGETGTGKELFAQSVHHASKRKSAPFVAINCAAFSPGVLESELFGYVKGAFTGASNEGKQGVFELAHEGTIFLDEISETPLDVQLKLLRVIQERKVMRIGDDKVTPINVRIITATNKDLLELVEKGKFREDFYYRICVLKLNLPSLKERREDIPLLVKHFLKHSQFSGYTITEDVFDELSKRPWKGNVRQLGNMIEQLAVLCDNHLIDRQVLEIAEDGSPLKIGQGEDTVSGIRDEPKKIEQSEKEFIREVLRSNKGKKVLAAVQLGISTTTLWRRMNLILKEEPHFFDLVKYGK